MKKCILFFFFCMKLYAPTIQITDLSQKNIETLREYQKNNPGPLIVKIEGEQTILQSLLEWGEWIFGQTEKTGHMDGWFFIKPILQGIMGGAFVSYGAIFYIIYRAYRLLKTVGSWAYSADKTNDEELILYIRQIQTKTSQKYHLQEIKKEKNILEQYFKIHRYLCRWRIRKFFPYDKVLHGSLVKSYKRLCAVEKQLYKIEK